MHRVFALIRSREVFQVIETVLKSINLHFFERIVSLQTRHYNRLQDFFVKPIFSPSSVSVSGLQRSILFTMFSNLLIMFSCCLIFFHNLNMIIRGECISAVDELQRDHLIDTLFFCSTTVSVMRKKILVCQFSKKKCGLDEKTTKRVFNHKGKESEQQPKIRKHAKECATCPRESGNNLSFFSTPVSIYSLYFCLSLDQQLPDLCLQ